MQKTRVRIRFSKTGDVRWISHRDLARVWERLLRRSNLSLAFSEGFHPKPKISFPSALALGIEAFEEVVELELQGAFDLSEVEQRIGAQMLAGLDLISIELLPPGAPKAQAVASRFRIAIAPEMRAQIQSRIVEIFAQPLLTVQRDEKTVVVQTADRRFEIQIEGDYLYFTLPTTQQGAMRPSELLEYMGLGDLVEQGGLLQRVELILDDLADGRATAEALCVESPSDVELPPE